MNPSVDNFFAKAVRWKKELEQLRAIILECGLAEELKWGSPCYSYHGHNVVIIGELKAACVAGFFKGALLSDSDGLLIKQGENTQVARSLHFTSRRQLIEQKPVIQAYIYEAIELEKGGFKVEFKSPQPDLPAELEEKFKKSSAFKKAFYALTPGRQRAYLLHFNEAKQPKTREARIEKKMPQIMAGKGLHDEYHAKKKHK